MFKQHMYSISVADNKIHLVEIHFIREVLFSTQKTFLGYINL